MVHATNEFRSGSLPPGLSDRVGYLLRRAFVRAQQYGNSGMPAGRQLRELPILIALDESGSLSQGRLGELFGLNRTSMVEIADGLETDGLISRNRNPADRRSYALRITTAGQDAITALQDGSMRRESILTSALTPANRERLADLLRAVANIVPSQLPQQLTDRNCFLIARAHFSRRAEADRALRGLGIGARHFAVMTVLSRLQPCSQQRLATTMDITCPAVLQTIRTMETASLISRERNSADRREYLFTLTAAGRSTLDQASSIIDRLDRQLADRIGHNELYELITLLTAITT